jgi:ABC-type transporter Mla subunit MlaD
MDILCKAIALIADFITAILGLLAIGGLIRHRKKISAFLRLLAHTLVNERIRRIRGTLTRLDGLNFGVKEDRKEIIAILGELAGMIRTFAKNHNDFQRIYDELINYTTTSPESLSEATKRRISEEINCLLEDQALAAALNLMEDSNGTKTN